MQMMSTEADVAQFSIRVAGFAKPTPSMQMSTEDDVAKFSIMVAGFACTQACRLVHCGGVFAVRSQISHHYYISDRQYL